MSSAITVCGSHKTGEHTAFGFENITSFHPTPGLVAEGGAVQKDSWNFMYATPVSWLTDGAALHGVWQRYTAKLNSHASNAQMRLGSMYILLHIFYLLLGVLRLPVETGLSIV